MDRKLYAQIDEVLNIRMLFPERGIYEVLDMVEAYKNKDMHKFLKNKLDFLNDLKLVVTGLSLSDKLRREFFAKACDEIENEINEKAIVLASQKFNELYDQLVADENEEERLIHEYKVRKLEEFKIFVNSKTNAGIALN